MVLCSVVGIFALNRQLSFDADRLHPGICFLDLAFHLCKPEYPDGEEVLNKTPLALPGVSC